MPAYWLRHRHCGVCYVQPHEAAGPRALMALPVLPAVWSLQLLPFKSIEFILPRPRQHVKQNIACPFKFDKTPFMLHSAVPLACITRHRRLHIRCRRRTPLRSGSPPLKGCQSSIFPSWRRRWRSSGRCCRAARSPPGQR